MSINIPDSSALPITRRRKRRPRKPAATQAERDALQLKAIKAEFDWSNDEWAETWLPWVRMSSCVVNGDEATLKSLMQSFVADGQAPNVLEGFARAKMHIEALHKLIGAAQTRSFLMLERLGYSPENLPPDTRVN